jgi:hypothetical protein
MSSASSNESWIGSRPYMTALVTSSLTISAAIPDCSGEARPEMSRAT